MVDAKKIADLLLKKYKNSVFNLVLRMVRNTQEAEDLTQEAFIKAFKALGKFKTGKSFKNWLFRILINECIDKKRTYYYRYVKTHSIRNEDNFIISNENINFEERDLIRRVFRKISGRQKKVLVLNDIEGFSIGEISEILECSISTVRVHLFRARKKFMKLYNKYEKELLEIGKMKNEN